MREQCLYRVLIVERPEFEEYFAFDERSGEASVLWNRPLGWEATPDYIDHYKSNKFFEPRTERWYKSRSSAKGRADLLNSMGYVAVVQRSEPVVWPDGARERVSTGQEIREAVRVLRRCGLPVSVESLLGGV